jgi:hypothetical protein
VHCDYSSPGRNGSTSTTPRVRVPQLVVDYFAYAARPGASARRTARHAARRPLLQLPRASGCLSMSRGSSCGTLHRLSSTTSPTLRVRVPRHVARLVTPLVIDYFAYATRPGASACRRLLRLRRTSGCLGTSRGSSRGSSSTTSTTPRVRVPRQVVWLLTRLVAPLVVDYFTYAARLGASACCAARRATRH